MYEGYKGGPLPNPLARVQALDTLLRAHAAAWWRDIKAADFVERVNDTYAAYLAGGGSDAHYHANWRAFSDAAKALADINELF